MTTSAKRKIEPAGMKRAAALLKVLSHPDRLQILFFIEEQEKKVTDIQKHVDLTQAMTSQHLKVLFETGYLDRRRAGTSIYYKLNGEQGKNILPRIRDCEELWNGGPITRSR